MSLTKRQREIEAANRAEAGLPVHRCPSCQALEAHWVPDSIDDHDLIQPGYFVCERRAVAADVPELDIEVTP